MNTTQSIIVYRNPAEQMLWEGGYAFPLFASLAAIVLVFIILMTLVEKTFGVWYVQQREWISYTVFAASLFFASLVFNFLYI